MNRNDIEKIINEIIFLIDKSSGELIGRISIALSELPQGILDLLIRYIDVENGAIKFKDESAAGIIRVRKYINEYVNDAAIKLAIDHYIAAADDIDILSQDAFSLQRKGINVAGLFADRRQSLLEIVRQNLIDSAYRLDILEPLMKTVNLQVLSGGNLTELKRSLKNSLSPDRLRYLETAARDGLNGYYGTQVSVIAEKYGYDRIMYVGSVKESTRPICRHIINAMDGVIEKKELPALIKKYKGTSGFMPDTNENNFLIKRGGYGCMHQAYPILK